MPSNHKIKKSKPKPKPKLSSKPTPKPKQFNKTSITIHNNLNLILNNSNFSNLNYPKIIKPIPNNYNNFNNSTTQ